MTYFAESKNDDGEYEQIGLSGRSVYSALGEFIFELAHSKEDDLLFDFYEDDRGETYLVGTVRKEGGEVTFSPV